MNDDMEKVKQELTSKGKKEKVPNSQDYLSTGITLLNLANYGRTNGGLVKGRIYRVQGRSSSGKTWLGWQVLAEAARNSHFDEYELIYDDVERGSNMDLERFFGKKLATRVQPPAGTRANPTYSVYTSEFYKRLNTKLAKGKKVIWIEDSLDSLDADTTTKMGDGKAKIHSQELRRLLQPLDQTGSILILVSQVRSSMSTTPWGPSDVTAGGMAPEFYATLEIVLKKVKAIKRKYMERTYTVGNLVSCRVKKNRLSGRDRVIFFPFDPEIGIDDLAANVDFLIQSNYWKKKESVITAEEFDFQGPRSKLIKMIEEGNKERELQILTGRVWTKIETALTVGRKGRYE